MPADRRFLCLDAAKRLAKMDRAFGRMGLPFGLRCVPWGSLAAVDIYGQRGAIVLTVEVPGVKPADLGLALRNELVTLKEGRK